MIGMGDEKMGRNDREKLTDRINSSNYVFSRKVNSFEEAYPTVVSLRVEVTERDVGLGGSSQSWTLTEKNFNHALNCSNPRCYGGGVEIGWIIHDMARDRRTDLEETKKCQGYEGSPKGMKRYRSCLHSFHIRAHVEYKNEIKKSDET